MLGCRYEPPCPARCQLVFNKGTEQSSLFNKWYWHSCTYTCKRLKPNPVRIHPGCQWGCSSMVECLPNIKGLGSLSSTTKKKQKKKRKKEKDLILDVCLTSLRCLIEMSLSMSVKVFSRNVDMNWWAQWTSSPHKAPSSQVSGVGGRKQNLEYGRVQSSSGVDTFLLPLDSRAASSLAFGLWESHFHQTSAAGS